jgi:hypothetical protein
MLKKIGYLLLLVLLVIQFIRPEKNQSAQPQPFALSAKYTVPPAVGGILKKACNDCHTNNTHYPWYYNIQPVAWWLADHVKEGKGELNFDEFLNYSQKKAHHKMEEVIEMVKEGEMPLKSYTIVHGDARLSQQERVAITDWASGVMKQIETASPEVLLKK